MRKIAWFIFISLFVGNCILTTCNYIAIQRLSFNEGISLSNKRLIMELAKKVVSDDEALKGGE